MATKLQIGAANPLTLDDNLLEGFRARVSAGEDANLVSREFFQSAAKEISDAQARVVAAEGRHADGFATPDDLARKYGLNNANELGILKGQATDQDTGVLALAAALRNVAQPTQFVPGSLQSGKPVVQPGTVVPVPTATTVKSDSIKAPPGKFIVLPGGRELHYDYADPTIKAAADAGQYQIRTEPGYVFKQPDQMTTGPKQVPQQGGAAAVIPGGVFGGQPTTTGAPAIQATANIPTIPLQPGARGDAVKQLQDYLVSLGLMTAEQVATGPGIYGPQTTAAVQALQQRLGVDNSSGPGYFGPRTIAALQASGQNQVSGVNANNTNVGTVTTAPQDGTGGFDPAGEPSGSYIEGSNTNLRSLLGSVGIQLGPQTSLTDMVKEISKLYGFDEINGEIKKIDDEYVDAVANINDDPWISEGLRVKRIEKLKDKYDMKRMVYTERLKLQNDIVGKAVQLFQAEKAQEQALLLRAVDARLDEVAETGETTTDIREYNLAVSQGYSGTFLDWQKVNANLKATAAGSSGSVLGGAYSSSAGSSSSGSSSSGGKSGKRTGNDSQILEGSRGSDGYVDPNVYLRLFQKYIDTGKTLKQFLTAYPPAQYVNPANTWLPSYLMPKKSSGDSIDFGAVPSL